MEKKSKVKTSELKAIIRCKWVSQDKIYQDYHDCEWGIPLHEDSKLFELLILETFQAGLSWLTVLKKRENFRKAFNNFDAKKISGYKEEKIIQLMNNEGIIRNKLKIGATIINAKAYLEIQKEFGTFDKYIWQFTNYESIINAPSTIGELPTSTPLSDAMSKDLKKRGFKFTGTTICYAFMQASGMVNDHTRDCFRFNKQV